MIKALDLEREQSCVLIRIIITALLSVILSVIPVTGIPRFILFLLVYLIIAADILVESVKSILEREPFDETLLMTIATIGAFALAIYQRSGDYIEAIMVMLFYQTGELFSDISVDKSKKSITDLMDLRPDYANIERNGELVAVDPTEIKIGDIIVVKPGEKIPLDGIVEKGCSSLNTSSLTGESTPQDVEVGSEVLSGSINITGPIYIRVTKLFGDSTASKILQLVESSAEKKAPAEKFITKFARIYTPIVILAAVIVTFLPPCILMLSGQDSSFGTWLYRGLTFLVISCPCALVISIPLTFFAGIGEAGKKGILIKGSNLLESLSNIKRIAFDKTGTLTEGTFTVTRIHSTSLPEDRLLELCAFMESSSSHPIGKAISAAYGKPVPSDKIQNLRELPGLGIMATIEDEKYLAGNEKLMNSENIPVECTPSQAGTVIHLGKSGEYLGYILISDTVKTTSIEAIKALKTLGVEKTYMFTGDNESTANAIGELLGIDRVSAELLPQDKVACFEALLSENTDKKNKIAFVGDGINDAPVLMEADVGVSMGGIGSDASIEASDVVIMDDNLNKLPTAIKVARKTMNKTYENIVIALGTKIVCMVLGSMGLANMALAIFADVGVMIICVINAIR